MAGSEWDGAGKRVAIRLGMAAVACLPVTALCAAAPAPSAGPRAVVYLVNGWSNQEGILLRPDPESPDVIQWLEDNLAEVRCCWWNSLHPSAGQNPGPWPEPFTDHQFVRDLAAELEQIPAEQRVVLIGHSFGADALLKVVRRTSRPVDFLGTLDPTGPFGLRSVARRRKVPASVGFVWNRWQAATAFPFDFLRTARLNLEDPRATTADQQRVETRSLLAHERMRSNAGVQRSLVQALDGLNGWPALESDEGGTEITLPEGSTLDRRLTACDPDARDSLAYFLEAAPVEAARSACLTADGRWGAHLRWLATDGPSEVTLTAYVQDDGWPCGSYARRESVSRSDGFSQPPTGGRGGKWAAVRFSVRVTNVAPNCSVEGPRDAVTGRPVALSVRVSDPSAEDTRAGLSLQVDWGDGLMPERLVTGSAPTSPRPDNGRLTLEHTFAGAGTYTIRVTAADKEGGTSEPVIHVLDVAEQDVQ